MLNIYYVYVEVFSSPLGIFLLRLLNERRKCCVNFELNLLKILFWGDKLISVSLVFQVMVSSRSGRGSPQQSGQYPTTKGRFFHTRKELAVPPLCSRVLKDPLWAELPQLPGTWTFSTKCGIKVYFRIKGPASCKSLLFGVVWVFLWGINTINLKVLIGILIRSHISEYLSKTLISKTPPIHEMSGFSRCDITKGRTTPTRESLWWQLAIFLLHH